MKSTKLCAVSGCPAPVVHREWCDKHYQRWRRYGRADVYLPKQDGDHRCIIDGCGKPVMGHGYCSMHYTRLREHGDVHYAGATPEDRYWRHVQRGGAYECWEWEGTRHQAGYGVIVIDGRKVLAHRLAWKIAHGAWPPDHLCVCHTCDNPPCQNPVHHFLGDRRDNAQDAAQKGRIGKTGRKLSYRLAQEIRRRRANGERVIDLAVSYGVCEATIANVLSRKSWAVPDATLLA